MAPKPVSAVEKGIVESHLAVKRLKALLERADLASPPSTEHAAQLEGLIAEVVEKGGPSVVEAICNAGIKLEQKNAFHEERTVWLVRAALRAASSPVATRGQIKRAVMLWLSTAKRINLSSRFWASTILIEDFKAFVRERSRYDEQDLQKIYDQIQDPENREGPPDRENWSVIECFFAGFQLAHIIMDGKNIGESEVRYSPELVALALLGPAGLAVLVESLERGHLPPSAIEQFGQYSASLNPQKAVADTSKSIDDTPFAHILAATEHLLKGLGLYLAATERQQWLIDRLGKRMDPVLLALAHFVPRRGKQDALDDALFSATAQFGRVASLPALAKLIRPKGS